MRLHKRWNALALSGVVAATTAIFTVAGGAHATTGSVDPSIMTDPHASNGTIAFYNSAGTHIYTGPLAHIADYAVASSPTARIATTKAALYFAKPDHTLPDSASWNGGSLTAASNFPVTTPPAPASVVAAEAANGGDRVPVNHAGATDGDLGGAFAQNFNDPTPGYDHVLQVRLQDSGPGKPAAQPFWQADVYIDTAAGTWTQLFPAPPTLVNSSISTITATPTSPAPAGTTSANLSATLSAADGTHPAGAVELFNGTTDLGAATLNAATGAITATTPVANSTSYSYTFKFTPSGNYNASTSPALAYTVTASAVAAATTTVVSGPAATTVNVAVTEHADVKTGATKLPAGAGSVQFAVNGTNAGGPVALTAAGADFSYLPTAAGSGKVTASFTPAAGQNYAASADTTGVTVIAAAPTVPATTISPITATPASPAPAGTTSANLTATLSASDSTHPAGSVELFNGTTDLGAATLNADTGAITATTPVANSTSYSYTFKFTPSGNSNASTSPALAYSVAAPAAVTTTLLTGPATTTVGTAVNEHADVKTGGTAVPAGAGSVQFSVDGTPKGAPVPVTATGADFSYTPATAGSAKITAAFTPAAGQNFGASADTTGVTVTATAATMPTTTISPITATPVSPAPTGTTSVGLSATLTASDSTHPAGSVELFNGATDLGAATVSATGAITATTSVANSTSYSFKFTFTPTGNYGGATSAILAYSVGAPVVIAATTTTVSGPSTVQAGSPVTLHADVKAAGTAVPAGAGSVHFSVGGTPSGAPLPITATGVDFTYTPTAAGSFPITASFAPTVGQNYQPSTDTTGVTLTVTAAPLAQTAISAINASPVSPAPAGTTTVALTATLTSATGQPAGAVELFDGATDLGQATYDAATGAISKNSTVSDGMAYSYTFKFSPSGSYQPSTSAALAYTVNAPVTAPVMALILTGPASTTVGLPVTVHAAVKLGPVPVSAGGGTVQFLVDGTAAGLAVTVADTGADFTYSPTTAGSAVITAVFSPISEDYQTARSATGLTVTATTLTPAGSSSASSSPASSSPASSSPAASSSSAPVSSSASTSAPVSSTPVASQTPALSAASTTIASTSAAVDATPASSSSSSSAAVTRSPASESPAVAVDATTIANGPLPANAGGGLASTGSNSIGLLVIGLLFITGGLAALGLARARH